IQAAVDRVERRPLDRLARDELPLRCLKIENYAGADSEPFADWLRDGDLALFGNDCLHTAMVGIPTNHVNQIYPNQPRKSARHDQPVGAQTGGSKARLPR